MFIRYKGTEYSVSNEFVAKQMLKHGGEEIKETVIKTVSEKPSTVSKAKGKTK